MPRPGTQALVVSRADKIAISALFASSLVRNNILNRQQNRPRNPTTTVPKKESILILPYLGAQSKIVTKQLKTCINRFYGCIALRVIFQGAHRIKSFFPYKDKISRSQMSKVVYKASWWDCQDFYIGKTKRRLHDRKTEHVMSCICYRRPSHANWSQLKMGPLRNISKRSLWYPLQDKGVSSNSRTQTDPKR